MSMPGASCHAWILLAVGNRPNDLRGIIAAADWMNHAIPTAAELRESLGYLRAAGLIERSDEGESARYGPSAAGAAFMRAREAGKKRAMLDLWRRVEAALTPLPYTPEPLGDAAYRRALDAYLAP